MQNYVFFFNNHFICFTGSLSDFACKITNYEKIIYVEEKETVAIDFSGFFSELNKQNWIIVSSSMLKIIIRGFLKDVRVIRAGGGLIKNVENKFLFIYRNGIWDLPKGKPEEKETIQHTALREVKEECGFSDVNITGYITKTYHIYNYDNTNILKKTYWFEMITEEYDNLKPQEEEGITDLRWIGEEELESVIYKNTYPNIKLLLKIYFGEKK